MIIIVYWLSVEYRIKYKLGVLMHNIHRRQSPHYLGDIVQLAATTTTRPGLRSADSDMYKLPWLKTVLGESRCSCCVEQSAGFNPGLYKHFILLPTLKDSFFKI